MKKNLQFLIICLIISTCQAQHEYHITGKVQGIPDSTLIDLFVVYENVGTRIATDTIMNGMFSFSDSAGSKLSRMNLRLRDMLHYSGNCNLWVDNTDIKVSGNSKYLSQWHVSSNIKEQTEENKLLDQSRDLRIEIDSLQILRMHNAQNKAVMQEISNNIFSISNLIFDRELAYLKTNYNSLNSVMELNSIAQSGDSAQKEIIRGFYLKIDTVYSNTLWGEGIKNYLNKVIPPGIGERFVNFPATDLKGKSHQLTDYTGKYLLLDFWSMACYPCILAAPEMREITDKYQKELYVIGINLDTRKQFWEEATKRDSITWINLSDGKGTLGGASTIYGIEGFPTYLLIDPQGIIVERWMGFENGIFDEKLSKYLLIRSKDLPI